MKKKTIIWLIIIIVIIAGFIIGKSLLSNKKEEYTLRAVGRANIVQEISETGTVKMGEEIHLSFRRAGSIEGVYVSIGQPVNSGQNLAKLDTRELSIQLTDAQAQQEVAQANLNKLLAGATPEEIQVKETAAANAKIILENSKRNLADVRADAEEDLISAYQDAVNIIEDAYLEINNSANLANSIQRSYFSSGDQESIQVIQSKSKINLSSAQAKSWLNSINGLVFNNNKEPYNKLDEALDGIKKELQDTSDDLIIIRQMAERPNYWNSVSSSDKTLLDNQRSSVNADLTNIVNGQQTIFSAKTTNQTNINTAQANVDSTQGTLNKLEDELNLLKASPRSEDIDLYKAQLKQAEAKTNILRRQIADSYLTSPVNGQITKIEKRIGETVQPAASDWAVTILPETPFQIEVNIYEEDVVKMTIGNPVDINLVAFPEKVFTGKVVSIEPAEKIVEEVVYYKTTIDFDEIPEGIKPGMTADITIKTASKENVLAISKRAIKKKDGKVFVGVLDGKDIREKEIEIGLEGSEGMVEVISGLAEGEEVVIK